MSETTAARQRGTLAPLRNATFRWLWIASVVSNVGTWMQNVGAAWLMALLTPSPLYVALVQSSTSLPVFLLGIPAGALADIVDRRKLLLWTQGGMLAAAGILGVMTLAGYTGPWSLLLLTFALGVGSTMNGPAWNAIMPELVPREELPAAIALNSAGFNLARAVGPALGGAVLAAASAGPAFLLNAVSFVGVMVVLWMWRRRPRDHAHAEERISSAMLAGIRYVRFAPPMHAVLLRSAAFVTPASALWAILPLLAKTELRLGSTGYGVLLGCLGAGSVLGATVLSRLRERFSPNLLVSAATTSFGCVAASLYWLHHFGFVCLVLVAGGMSWMTVNSNLNIATQTTAPSWVRARALGMYLLVFQSAMAVGSALAGAIAERFGVRTTLFAAGLTLFVSATVTFRLKLGSSEPSETLAKPHWPEPTMALDIHPDSGPVLVAVEYQIDLARRAEFIRVMQGMRTIRRRDGAMRWSLFEDAAAPGRMRESFLVESWAEHLRQHERMTAADRDVQASAHAFHLGDGAPPVTHWVAAEPSEEEADE
ncbi:MAG: MFS transporter [Bryobacteraceae bacterium]